MTICFPASALRRQCATTFSGDFPCSTVFLAPLEAISANSVLTEPGQSAQTFIPMSAVSAASASVKLRTYAFVAAYTAKLPNGITAARLATFINIEVRSI